MQCFIKKTTDSEINIRGSTTQNIIDLHNQELILKDKPSEVVVTETTELLNTTTQPSITDMYYENLRVFTHSGTQEAQTIKTFILEHNTICYVLIVAGGGGGDRCQVGGGGGGGGVVFGQNIIIPAGSYQLKIGTGGGSNSTGHNSEGFGATVYGGGTTIYTPWPTGNAGSAGGSGSGGSAGNSATGVMQNGGGVTASIKGTILAASTVYGNAGGKSRTTANSYAYSTGGGGGAGGIGHDSLADTAVNCVNRAQYLAAGSPSKGRTGIMINILGIDYYWGAGGGGGNRLMEAMVAIDSWRRWWFRWWGRRRFEYGFCYWNCN